MKNVPAILEDVELGPACKQLSGKRLRFAAALVFEVLAGPGAPAAAGKIAGYAESTAKALARDKHIIAAVEELARQRLVLDVPLALNTLRDAMSEKYGRDKVKSAIALLDRVLPTKQEIRVETTVIDRTQQTLDYLAHLIAKGASEQMLLAEFGPGGLERYRTMLAEREAKKQQQQTIDAEYTVIEGDQQPAPAADPVLPAEPVQKETEVEAQTESLEDLL